MAQTTKISSCHFAAKKSYSWDIEPDSLRRQPIPLIPDTDMSLQLLSIIYTSLLRLHIFIEVNLRLHLYVCSLSSATGPFMDVM